MAYEGINKIQIFLDTNVIETRHEESCLTLNSIKMHPDFYRLLDFCEEFTEVRVYIPAIVWKEVCVHLINCFRSTAAQMSTKLKLYQKTFGDLIDLNLDIKGYDVEKYSEYLEKISQEFWELNKDYCSLIDLKMSEDTINKFVDKAVKAVKPFTQAKSSKKSKDYSDAGFKDAIIVETILATCDEDAIAILFTDDTDFNEVFKLYDESKYIALNTLNDVKEEINIILKRNDSRVVKALFENNAYMQETLFSLVDVPFDKSITDFMVENVEKIDELYLLKIKAHANEVEYSLSVTYDVVANEIIDVKPILGNE